MSIVELGPEDWQECRAIRLRALADAPDAFSVMLEDAEQRPDELWREPLTLPGPTIAVRTAGGLVAMGGGYLPPEQPDVMMVWGMWTAPEARGRGHARALVSWLLDWAQDRGISTVELHVTEGNDTARALYESCGFVATGEWGSLREGSPLRIELLRRSNTRASEDTQKPSLRS